MRHGSDPRLWSEVRESLTRKSFASQLINVVAFRLVLKRSGGWLN